MNHSITFRLTPARERLLKLVKKRYKVKKNSEAIDIALKISYDGNSNYSDKIKKVKGCIKLNGEKNAIKKIRSLRNGQ